MTRRQKDPLRPLTQEERKLLVRVGRSHAEPASHVARAKALLAVADGQSYIEAAKARGRRSGDAVSELVSRFNREGVEAVEARRGGGRRPTYAAGERERILAEARREPDREKDGTVEWSLSTLRRSLRQAPDGLPEVSTHTIWKVLRGRALAGGGAEAGARPAGSNESAKAERWSRWSIRIRRLKSLIERAYGEGGKLMGLSVWGADQAGPFQTAPYPGASWEMEGKPARQPHQRIRNGAAKLMTLFHPATGRVRVKGARSCTNAVLHPRLKDELETILSAPPGEAARQPLGPEENRAMWKSWREGLSVRVTPPEKLPPLRMLFSGQPHGTQESGASIVDVRQGSHGALHAFGSLLAEHDRVGAANPRPAGAGRTLSRESRRDHRVAGSYGAFLEPRSDAI